MNKNLDTLRAAHQAFNRHDFDAITKVMADHVAYRDTSTGTEYKGKDGFRQFLTSWKTAASNAEVHSASYIDAGSYVVAMFKARGTNDGPLGEYKPSNRKFEVDFCEVVEFDDQGRIVSGRVYYDQVSLLSQLGHIQVPKRKAA